MTALTRVSFHDPSGSVFTCGERILRRVDAAGARRLRAFLATPVAAELLREGRLPATRELGEAERAALGTSGADGAGDAWFEHASLPFRNYAHEWTPEMLLDAAELTLAIAGRLHEAGWDLKDAATSNVVFDGARPVFVDLCSIVERSAAEPYWWPKGQFERHFVLPLLAFALRGVSPARIHGTTLDGLDPADAVRLFGAERWLSGMVLRHCTLPALLGRRGARAAASPHAVEADAETSRVAQRWQLRSLARTLARIRRRLPLPRSAWGSYTDERPHYDDGALSTKRRLVGEWLSRLSPRAVLDLGSNTGEFSQLAAATGALVVGAERDLEAARVAYRRAREEGYRSLSLVQDVASPSPGLGWRNRERASFDERAAGRFDCVLALALVHHLVAAAGIPAEEIVELLARWTTRSLIVEHVAPEDPMFRALAAQRRLDCSGLGAERFRALLERRFRIVAAADVVPGLRTLMLCELAT